MNQKDSRKVVRRIEITGDLDRHAVEALYLEIRRLARRYGVAVKGFRVEEVTGETVDFGEDEETAG